MKHYKNTMMAVIVSLSLFALLFIIPRIGQDEIHIQDLSGDSSLLENRLIFLSYEKKENPSYIRNAYYKNGRYTWNMRDSSWEYHNQILSQFPIGQRPKDLTANRVRVSMEDHRFLFLSNNYEGEKGRLTYGFLDSKNNSIKEFDHHFENKDLIYQCLSTAFKDGKIYILLHSYDSLGLESQGFYRLTLDEVSGEAIEEERIVENLDTEFLSQTAMSQDYNYIEPAAWIFTGEIENKRSGKYETNVLIIDPENFEVERIETDQVENSYENIVYKDRIYFLEYSNKSGQVHFELKEYLLNNQNMSVVYESQFSEDSSASASFADGAIIILEPNGNHQARLLALDLENKNAIYEGKIVNDNLDYKFIQGNLTPGY